jgi:hypothetical protein
MQEAQRLDVQKGRMRLIGLFVGMTDTKAAATLVSVNVRNFRSVIPLRVLAYDQVGIGQTVIVSGTQYIESVLRETVSTYTTPVSPSLWVTPNDYCNAAKDFNSSTSDTSRCYDLSFESANKRSRK